MGKRRRSEEEQDEDVSLSTARHYVFPHSEGQFLIVDARASDGPSEKRDYHGRANEMILGYLSFSVGGTTKAGKTVSFQREKRLLSNGELLELCDYVLPRRENWRDIRSS